MLFETYGHDPHLLMAMWTSAKSLGVAYEMGDDFELKKGVPPASVNSFQERIRKDYNEIGSSMYPRLHLPVANEEQSIPWTSRRSSFLQRI